MKTLRLIGMALVAVIMSVNFVSCSDDDEEGSNDSPSGITGKCLVQDMESEDLDDISYYNYTSDGWLKEVIRSEGDQDNVYFSYNKQGEDTYVTGTWGDGEECGRIMFNDRIRTIDGEECIYDSEGHLIQCGEVKFVWENGNIVKSENRYETRTYTYYTDKENKHPIDSDPILSEFDELFFIKAHPHLIGKQTKNLVKSTWIEEEDNWTFTYTLDSDGYVLSYKTEGNEDNDFDYKWK